MIVLNTTPDYAFAESSTQDNIMNNHGIHGVQDMCNLLKRRKRDFIIETGHWEESDVIDRVITDIKGIILSRKMSSSRVGIIGKPFWGMGDFSVPYSILKEKMGVKVIEEDPGKISSLLLSGEADQVLEEVERDNHLFEKKAISESVHIDSVRIGLALRKWIRNEELDGFSINFSGVDAGSGFPAFPFLEASKSMARGIGYAGEGDVLTASLTGTILKLFPQSSFVEMFCPDWKNNRIFLSHMGEVNHRLITGKPLMVENDQSFMEVGKSVFVSGQLKKGDAAIINLAPDRNNNFNLIIIPVKMVEVKNKNLSKTISGWFETPIPINDFLSEYSRIGGTHHSCLVYTKNIKVFEVFGRQIGWNVYKISKGDN